MAARQRAQRGAARPVRLLPRQLVRAAAGAGRGRARHRRVRERVRERGRARRPSTGCSRTRRSPGPTGCALLANFVRACARGRMILLPAVDIRDGKAVRLRQGTSTTRRSTPTTRSRPPARSSRPGARFLHVVDLDGAREGEPVNLHHVERITRELAVPVELGGGLRSIASIRRALKAGADARGARHGRVHRPGPAGRGAGAFTVAHARGRRRARRQGVGGRLDARDPDARRGRDPPDAAARRHALRLHERRPRRDARGPGPRRGPARGGGRARALPLLGRDRLARRPGGAARPAAGQPRRRDLGQGALRGPLRGGRGPGASLEA